MANLLQLLNNLPPNAFEVPSETQWGEENRPPQQIMGGMIRPCFLIVDQEYAGSISTRKLVIETAKLNVLTAYSPARSL